ncbi:uncharacterized protein LOC132936958 [Metopolophium dirhodum]|uniref:uncharacterized protein LOC132936958 n=1 Tax=Metopolophium dirhodum TaxID=44670 RepID=UPI00298FB020|nr:uncharacterized protein LOC132936958 [Metopolophium dirhodum]
MASVWNWNTEIDDEDQMDNYIQVNTIYNMPMGNELSFLILVLENDGEFGINAADEKHNETTDSILENDGEFYIDATDEQHNETTDSSSWSSIATKLLISLRGACNEKFDKIKKKGKKFEQWDMISKEMKAKNINVSPKQCDEKWRRLLTRFRQVRDASKKSGSGGIKWQYYTLIENAISPMARQTISPPKNLLHESSKDINSSIETPELENTISPITYPSYTATPKSLFKQNHHEKIPTWFSKFEKLRNDQLEATNNNANQLNIRLDKLEKRDEIMLKTQAELLKKLDDVNKIELQKIDLFNKMYDTNT